MMAMGFTPKRVAEFRELDTMQKRSQAVDSLSQRTFHQQQAQLLMSGGDTANEAVRQNLLVHAKENAGYDPRAGAKRIAELVQAQTIPFDPLRSGAASSGSYEIGQMFDRQALGLAEQPSEVGRLLGQHQKATDLGFPGSLGKREVQSAALVDRLMKDNPTMSRQEALARLLQVFHPRVAQYTRGGTAGLLQQGQGYGGFGRQAMAAAGDQSGYSSY
jgi:hypothetical protein